MFKKLWNKIKSLFTPEREMDEHAELYLKVPEPDVPIHVDPCPRHTRFIAKCHMCVAAAKGVNL